MRKYKLFQTLILCGGLLHIIACGDSLERHLEGKWQLKTVEQNGHIETVAIDSFRNMYGYKTIADEQHLELELVSYFITIKDFLPLTDWSTPKRTFQIEESTGSRLTLSSEGKTYKFEKY